MSWRTSMIVLRTVKEVNDLPVGQRIATNTNRLLVKDKAYGKEFWMEEGELTPYRPHTAWLPVYVLPPVLEEGVELEVSKQDDPQD